MDVEKARVEQAAYDAGMTKTTRSLTAQLKDVARIFCLEAWGQALTTTGVDIESELRTPDRIYYPSALCLAPTPFSLQMILALPLPLPWSSLPLPHLPHWLQRKGKNIHL